MIEILERAALVVGGLVMVGLSLLVVWLWLSTWTNTLYQKAVGIRQLLLAVHQLSTLERCMRVLQLEGEGSLKEEVEKIKGEMFPSPQNDLKSVH